ncbi:choice-of-anchor Q domain-containing protein [Chondromyces crocatus]|uniref:Right handed beta helix domain-containing protein n=1 Tax=Chondromyces crocatus TaxID=52 RepID=A0A0K1EMI4_CHOCO|nr:choice-of-anchor Q domain-containing protein [Chondromyces crocatus]AKT42036.1 uncharacterized protein CMC5_062580 [Chondromyces crocatus]
MRASHLVFPLLAVAAIAACGGDEGGSSSNGSGGAGGTGAGAGPGTGGSDVPPPPPPDPICDAPVAPVDVSQPSAVVGNGTPASCTEAALDAALASGSVIVFDCGPQPVTIPIRSAKSIQQDTVIDGGGRVTLDGGGESRIFELDTGNYEATTPTLTVQRLTFTGGKASGTSVPLGTDTDGGGGAIYHLGGTVVVIDSVFDGNACALEGPDVAGGAIYGIGLGETIVVGSTFVNNRGANGGAIGALGTALTIVNSTFVNNTATGAGANYVDGNGQQAGRGGNGGALVMDGRGRMLTICGTLVQENTSGAFGGALFRTGYETEPTVIDRSHFDGNRALDRTDDLPSGAGGLYIQGTRVTMTATTVSRNAARSSAGLWILGHGPAPAVADLTNVTLAGNFTWPREDFTQRGIGGGLTIGDNTTGTLLNCTVAGNQAQFASGIARVSSVTLRNTIVSNEADNEYTPLNCTGAAYNNPPGSGENNVQWPNGIQDDMDCVAGITRADPMLGPLGDHGGLAPTMVPAEGSPVLGAGTSCPPTDQRGNPRNTASCALGAHEP